MANDAKTTSDSDVGDGAPLGRQGETRASVGQWSVGEAFARAATTATTAGAVEAISFAYHYGREASYSMGRASRPLYEPARFGVKKKRCEAVAALRTASKRARAARKKQRRRS